MASCAPLSDSKDSLPQYTVTFDTDEGSNIASVTVKQGNKLPKPDDPAKTDYVFVNWYKDAAKTQTFDFAAETITATITLYAKWKNRFAAEDALLGGVFAYIGITPDQSGPAGFLSIPENSQIPALTEAQALPAYRRVDFPNTEKQVIQFALSKEARYKADASQRIILDARAILQPSTAYDIIVYEVGTPRKIHTFTTKAYNEEGRQILDTIRLTISHLNFVTTGDRLTTPFLWGGIIATPAPFIIVGSYQIKGQSIYNTLYRYTSDSTTVSSSFTGVSENLNTSGRHGIMLYQISNINILQMAYTDTVASTITFFLTVSEP
ncbi:InlB B-repeat-containing protein [Candidatus Haliotispira prima]|uniref:InlB B-repeat-containing protein n=1 Tax=Candidatus Haliotispira prima TaxID=3034016 RepID=A0ABY8MIV8_9SPIO|nr:InlB B-repeat-containing protein [Candidatus Haliotispira prima]